MQERQFLDNSLSQTLSAHQQEDGADVMKACTEYATAESPLEW